MATIPTIQLFRNSIIKTGRQAAIDALEAQKAFVADGGLILARYSEDGTENGVKTLLGIVRNGGGKNVQLTVIDVEGAAKNVQEAITSAINKLNKGDAEEEGQYVASVSEDKGIITVTRKDLPSLNKTSDSGKAITAITQTKGLVDVEFGGVAAANVSVASKKFTATTVEDALLEIQNSLDAAIGEEGSVGTQITNAINALDSATSSTTTHITVGVKQVDGKISSLEVVEDNIASASLLGTKDDASTAETAFGYIAKEVADRQAAIQDLKLDKVGADGKVITAISQSNGVVSATASTLGASSVAFSSPNFTSSTNVNEALEALYTQSNDGSKVTLESVDGTEGILKVYTIKQGGSEVGKINIPKDLVVQSGSVVKGNWNDGVFTENVSGSGTALKLVIANQTSPVYINTLDLVKDHTGGNGISISDTNVISVVRDPASENFLTVGADGVKLIGVQNAIDAASGQVNSIIEARLGTGVTSSLTATAQFAALSGQIASINTTIENLDATVSGGSDHVDVTVAQANGKITSVTVDSKDIASASALTSETSARQTADTELSNRLGNGVTTAATATAQLQALSGTNESNSGDTSVNGAKKYTVGKIAEINATKVSTSGTSTTEAIKIVQTNGKIESITLGAFDCGTY